METMPSDINDSRTGREVYLITSGQIINARTPGARRVLNIARSLAYGNVKVYIFSFIDFLNLSGKVSEIQEGVFGYSNANRVSTDNRGSLKQFLTTSLGYMKKGKSDTAVFLYPTTFILRDFIFLLYLKYIKGYRFFCDINELRSSIAFSASPPEGILRKLIYLGKSLRDYVLYSANEWQVRFYDGVSVISVALEKYFAGIARRSVRIPIICNGDDIAADITPKFYDGGVFKICFAGYVKIDKEGFDILLESLSQVNRNRSVELYIYGLLEDEDSVRLKKLADKYGVTDKLFYMGNMDPEKLQDEFRKYHLLILPRPLNRRTMYGLSTKLSEYLVSNTPVLVTDVSDNALFIKDNFNGFIIPPGSTDAMTEKISEIIASYNSVAHEIVENAHMTVREKLDYRLFSQQYIDFLFSSISKNHNSISVKNQQK